MAEANFIIKTGDFMTETGNKIKWMAKALFTTNQGQLPIKDHG